MCQVAAAEISHLEIDVAQIQSGQIRTTEIKTLKNSESDGVKCWLETVKWWGEWKRFDFTVPDSEALTWWGLPEESEQTPCGKWESGPLVAVCSVWKRKSRCVQGSDRFSKLQPFTFHTSYYLECYFQLFSKLLNSKEASLLEDTWKTFSTNIIRKLNLITLLRLISLDSVI